MPLTVPFDDGRAAFTESVTAFVAAVDGVSEYDLLASSRCHGWTRLDVVTHVLAGWQDMLGGFASVVDRPPTVDAASYWPAFVAQFGDLDPLEVLMSQRRRTDAYSRPRSARGHLQDVAADVVRGAEQMPDASHQWQRHVFAAGDFLVIWAVENVVHQLDLDLQDPPPSLGVRMARQTVEALVGEPLPTSWSDIDAVLVGTGRLPVPTDAATLADRLPALS